MLHVFPVYSSSSEEQIFFDGELIYTYLSSQTMTMPFLINALNAFCRMLSVIKAII